MKQIAQDDVTAAKILQANGLAAYPPYAGLVIHDETGVRGAVVISHVADGDAEISAVGQEYWTLGTARGVLRYVFDGLACERLTARCLRPNRACIRALKAVGFRQEGVKRGAKRSKDVIMFGMLRSECRWLRRA